MKKQNTAVLPVPGFYKPSRVEEWKWVVPWETRFDEAHAWAKTHDITPAASDRVKIALMVIDAQLTFCHPDFELFVGGRSGRGAIDDNIRLVEWIYRHLGLIHAIHPTLDTHMAFQIFHRAFWVDAAGKPPPPFTIISKEDVEKGVWQVNPAAAHATFGDGAKWKNLQDYALHYVQRLAAGGKYPLMVWPFHGMLGSQGHALVPALQEAAHFHTIVRGSQTGFQIKGGHALTENYSVLAPEVMEGPDGRSIGASKNVRFIEALLKYDAVIVAGQAKSHCVAWSIQHLLDEIAQKDPALAAKVYVLQDCMSAVVTPQIDFTDDADRTFAEFAKKGVNLVDTSTALEKWPGMKQILAKI